MSYLEYVDISNNSAISSLPESLYSISTLKRVDCQACHGLTSPPLTVCEQGVKAVRKYFKDLELFKGSNQRLIPVTVIGKSRAGKTSLVRSMQANERVLTERSPADGQAVAQTAGQKRDDATKVFKVCEADIDDTCKLIFADFGGQSIYHFAYQLTFKEKFVPFLVVDIADFDRLVSQRGDKAACQEASMEWLSHLYIACPKLGRPVVVLTQCDEIPDAHLIENRKQQLINITEKLRLNIIKSEKSVASSSSPLFIMSSFTDTSGSLLSGEKILLFSAESSASDIHALKQKFADEGKGLITTIPGNWYKVFLDMREVKDKPYIEIVILMKQYPDENNPEIILQYLHDTGRIMWFSKIKVLSQYVFHRPEVLTNLIEVLFSHTQEKTWVQRLEDFIPFDGIEYGEYKDMVEQFKSSGVMEGALLHNLLLNESQLSPEVAVEVLKTFHLIHSCSPCGDDMTSQKYIIPYFAPKPIVAPVINSQFIPLKVDIFLRGLPVPGYVYSLITAAYLDINPMPFCLPEVGTNGATVEQGDGMISYLLHSVQEKRVTLIMLTPPKKVGNAWKSQLKCLEAIIDELKSVWKAVRYEKVFYCSHCLLTIKQSPEHVTGPKPSSAAGDSVFICRKEPKTSESRRVPLPLMYPCKYNISI